MSTFLRSLMVCGVVSFTAAMAQPAVAETPTASLALASKPAGCQFQIVDAKGQIKAQGKTPYVGVLPAGRYMLKVEKAGFFTEQRGLILSGGQQRILQVVLTSSGQSTAAPTPPRSRGSVSPDRVVPPRATTPPARTAPAQRTPATGAKVPARDVPAARMSPAARTPAPTSRPVAPAQRAAPAATRTPPAQRGRQTPGGDKPAANPPARAAAPAARMVDRQPVKRAVPANATPQKASPNATTIDPPGKKKKDGKQAKKKKGRSIPWIPLVAAGGLAIAGGVFWGLSGGSLSAAQDRTKYQRDAFQEYQQGRTHRSTAIFLFAAGGAALGLAALFYFWNPTKRTKKTPPPDNSTPVGQIHNGMRHQRPPTAARLLMESSMP